VRWLTALAALLVGGLLAVPPVGRALASAPPLEAGDLAFVDYERVAHLDVYERPMTAIGYRDGQGAEIELPLTHTGTGGAVTVRHVDPFPELLGMVEVEEVAGLPATLAPGETTTVRLRARFTNCRYYTERAVNLFQGAEVTVDGAWGEVTELVDYPGDVVLRSPTILGCPDRVTDRSARQRLLARDE
jgi:hypothetical protein